LIFEALFIANEDDEKEEEEEEEEEDFVIRFIL